MNLIDKDVLVAEIEKLKHRIDDRYSYSSGWKDALLMVEAELDTLEVKEVDLEKSARNYLLHEHLSPLNNILHQVDLKTELQYHKDIETAFKAGFELSLKVNQKGE